MSAYRSIHRATHVILERGRIVDASRSIPGGPDSGACDKAAVREDVRCDELVAIESIRLEVAITRSARYVGDTHLAPTLSGYHFLTGDAAVNPRTNKANRPRTLIVCDR
jgi:hypothetical protein